MNILFEAKLVDLILDLHTQYGGASPRPEGSLVHFSIVADKTTYRKALNEIEALLDLHGVTPINLSIEPGPEVKMRYNRNVKFSLARSQVLGNY